jgi:hypothetical protein
MEVYRYFWTKVTDRAGRVASSKAAMVVMEQLEQGTLDPENVKRGYAWQELLAQARQYLGPDIEQTIKIVVARRAARIELDVMHDDGTTISSDDLQITIAPMPTGYTRDDALTWISNPVGAAWAQGALLRRLGHAVATHVPALHEG